MADESILFRYSVEQDASAEDAMLYKILNSSSKRRMAKPFFRAILMRGWISLLHDASHMERQTFFTGMQVPQNLIDEINRLWPVSNNTHKAAPTAQKSMGNNNQAKEQKANPPASNEAESAKSTMAQQSENSEKESKPPSQGTSRLGISSLPLS